MKVTRRPKTAKAIARDILRREADAAAAEALQAAGGICDRCGIDGGARRVVDRGVPSAECIDVDGCNQRLRAAIQAEAAA